MAKGIEEEGPDEDGVEDCEGEIVDEESDYGSRKALGEKLRRCV